MFYILISSFGSKFSFKFSHIFINLLIILCTYLYEIVITKIQVCIFRITDFISGISDHIIGNYWSAQIIPMA